MMNIKAHGNEKNYAIDRISSLPDEILMHILSFVSTREAVQTCILSKRWINTWASVLNLEFDVTEFGLPEFLDDMDVAFVTKFKLLVKSVLDKRETSRVNRFRLSLDSIYWPCTQAVANYIGDVMKLEPRECSITLSSYENLNSNTDLIFRCASLTDLQLWFYIKKCTSVAIESNSVKLPCLKTLNLKGVMLSDDFSKKVLLGCPVLEELVLQNCEMDIIEICSNTLKKLVLWSYYHVMRLQISMPNLLYLDIHVRGIEEILLLNMSSLVDASICISRWYDNDNYVTMGPKLIHSLSNVKCLQLEFYYPDGEVVKKDFSNCPVFNNLKCLKLLDWHLDDFDVALFFLLHSPKLQELTLEYNYVYYQEMGCLDEETTQEGPRDALVQREFLKTVRIVVFEIDNKLVDRLINKLLTHVKIIGEIIV